LVSGRTTLADCSLIESHCTLDMSSQPKDVLFPVFLILALSPIVWL